MHIGDRHSDQLPAARSRSRAVELHLHDCEPLVPRLARSAPIDTHATVSSRTGPCRPESGRDSTVTPGRPPRSPPPPPRAGQVRFLPRKGSFCQYIASGSPFTYGDDPALDAEWDVLWDACEAGDYAGCDDLYVHAYVSEDYGGYFAFAATCGNRNVLYLGTCEQYMS